MNNEKGSNFQESNFRRVLVIEIVAYIDKFGLQEKWGGKKILKSV